MKKIKILIVLFCLTSNFFTFSSRKKYFIRRKKTSPSNQVEWKNLTEDFLKKIDITEHGRFIRRAQLQMQKGYINYESDKAKDLLIDIINKYRNLSSNKYLSKGPGLGLDKNLIVFMRLLIKGLTSEELSQITGKTIDEIKAFLEGKGINIPEGIQQELFEKIARIPQEELKEIEDLVEVKVGKLEEEEDLPPPGDEDEDDDDEDMPPPPDDDMPKLLVSKVEKVVKKVVKKLELLSAQEIINLTKEEKVASDEIVQAALVKVAILEFNKQNHKSKPALYLKDCIKIFKEEIRKSDFFKKRSEFDSIFSKKIENDKFYLYVKEKIIDPIIGEKEKINATLDSLYNEFMAERKPKLFVDFVEQLKSIFFDSNKLDEINNYLVTMFINFFVSMRPSESKSIITKYISDTAAYNLINIALDKSKNMETFLSYIDYLRLKLDFLRYWQLLGGTDVGIAMGKFFPSIKQARIVAIKSFIDMKTVLSKQIFFDLDYNSEYLKNNKSKFESIIKNKIIIKGVKPVEIFKVDIAKKGIKSAFITLRRLAKKDEAYKKTVEMINKGEWNIEIIKSMEKFFDTTKKGWSGILKNQLEKKWLFDKIANKIQTLFKDLLSNKITEAKFYEELLAISEIKDKIKKNKDSLFRTPYDAISPIWEYLVADKKTLNLLKRGKHVEKIKSYGFFLMLLKGIEQDSFFFGRRSKSLIDILLNFNSMNLSGERGGMIEYLKKLEMKSVRKRLEKNVDILDLSIVKKKELEEKIKFEGASEYSKKEEVFKYILGGYKLASINFGDMIKFVEAKNTNKLYENIEKLVLSANPGFSDKTLLKKIASDDLQKMFDQEPLEQKIVGIYYLNKGEFKIGSIPIIPELDPEAKGLSFGEKVFRKACLNSLENKLKDLLKEFKVDLSKKDDLFKDVNIKGLNSLDVDGKNKFKGIIKEIISYVTTEINKLPTEKIFKNKDIAKNKNTHAIKAILELFDFKFLI